MVILETENSAARSLSVGSFLPTGHAPLVMRRRSTIASWCGNPVAAIAGVVCTIGVGDPAALAFHRAHANAAYQVALHDQHRGEHG